MILPLRLLAGKGDRDGRTVAKLQSIPQVHRGQQFNDIGGIGGDLRQYNGTRNLALPR